MGKYTVNTALYFSAVFYDYPEIPGTLHSIQRAVTEQTVDIALALVAGIILTIFIGKKLSGIIHF